MPNLRLRFLTCATVLIVATIFTLSSYGCRTAESGSGKQAYIGDFKMGEKVRVGTFTYTVLESKWVAALGDDPQARVPTNRYLLVRIAVVNSGNQSDAFPVLGLQSPNGQVQPEILERVSDAPNWISPLMRTLQPAQSATGTIVFDVPLGPYKLKVTEPNDTDTDNPRYALIDIPVQLE